MNFQWWNLLHYTDTEISHMALTDLELHYYMLAVPRENTRYHSTIVAHNSVFYHVFTQTFPGLIWADKMSRVFTRGNLELFWVFRSKFI